VWAAIESIAPKIGCVPQTLNEWVKRDQVDSGAREGVTTSERGHMKALERENKELRKANGIFKLASAFLMKLRCRLFSPRPSLTAVGSLEGLRRPASTGLRGRVDLQGSTESPRLATGSTPPSNATRPCDVSAFSVKAFWLCRSNVSGT
jgi:transposase